ncbi:MAG: hypothetical protein J6S43_03350 [Lentisphaeria bacterium]|nr:hypothetical protein [Lentisphaeria bacterium]
MFNIQPGSTGGRRSSPQRKQDYSGGVDALCGLLARVGSAALVILVIGAFFHTYIKLDQQINQASAEIARVDERIVQMNRDVEALNMRFANCSTREFIMRQIARFKLPLVELRQDQQQYIRVYSGEQLARLATPVLPPRQMAMDTSRKNISRFRRGR